jgi:hypothetical protein
MLGAIKRTLTPVCFLLCLLISPNLLAFPDKEITGITGGPPFSFGFTDDPTAFILKDNRTMLVTYGQVLRLVDLAFYALAAEQPKDLSDNDDENDNSPFNAAVYDSTADDVLITQERGHVIIYNLDDLEADPLDVTIEEGKALGPIAINETGSEAYVTNNTDHKIHVLDMSSLTVSTVVEVQLNQTNPDFDFTDAVFVNTASSAYFSTNHGAVVIFPQGGTVASIIDVGIDTTDNLTSVEVTPDDVYVYTTDSTTDELIKISVAGQTFTAIDLTPNVTPYDVVVTAVTNPTSEYAYVAGENGVSVVEVASDDVLDMVENGDEDEPIPTSAVAKKLVASTDGYVYMALATTAVGIISSNPWVTISSVTYSGGGESLGKGETVTIVFQSNEDGTYDLKVGGDVDGSGSLLTDVNGDTSGPVTADTDVAVEIPYDDNSTLFDEGDNDVFVFVTDSESDMGRRATSISVDTPPDVVTLESTGFGNSRIYVIFERLTASDIERYNIYVDTDPDAVLTKTEVAAVYNQPDSGDSITAEVDGLENSVRYFIAVEAVDEGGNVSPSRAYLLPSGVRASAIPQRTVGPAGFTGETGCTLNGTGSMDNFMWFVCLMIPLILFIGPRSTKNPYLGHRSSVLERTIKIMILVIALLLVPKMSHAQWVERRPSPQWWSFEVKTGFWMPQASTTKLFFDACCNIETRLQGGLLIHGRYGIEQGVGFMIKGGDAIGEETGEKSFDRFSLLLIPMETNFVWRMDYWGSKYVIPYIKTGIDYVYFRENTKGDVTNGVKFGVHGVGGLQVPLSQFSDDVAAMDADYGINEMSFTFEAQYQWLNNFGGKGLDLTGWLFSIGLLFTF